MATLTLPQRHDPVLVDMAIFAREEKVLEPTHKTSLFQVGYWLYSKKIGN